MSTGDADCACVRRLSLLHHSPALQGEEKMSWCCPLPATAAAVAMLHHLVKSLLRTQWTCLVKVKQEAPKEDIGTVQGCLNLGSFGPKIPVAENLDGSPWAPSCYLLGCLKAHNTFAHLAWACPLNSQALKEYRKRLRGQTGAERATIDSKRLGSNLMTK